MQRLSGIFLTLASLFPPTSPVPAVTAAAISRDIAADTLRRRPITPDTARADTLPDLTVSVSTVSHEATSDSYLITKDMRRNAHTAGDILGKIPGIHYNPLTQGLTHLGSGNVMILVDSLEKEPEYIKRLNPDRFSRISVTSFPSGKYAAYDAVINLVTKKVYTGYDGTLLSETILRPDRRNGSGNTLYGLREVAEATYTRGDWNFAFSGGFAASRTGNGVWSETLYPLNGYSQMTHLPPLKDPNRYSRKNQTGVRLWGDYRISKDHSISAGFSVIPNSMKESGSGEIFSTTGDAPAVRTFQEEETRYRSYISLMANLQYRGKAAGWFLSGSAQYTRTAFDRLRSLRREGFAIDDSRQVRTGMVWAGADASRSMAARKLYLSLSGYVTFIDYRERSLATAQPLSASRDTRCRFTAGLRYTPVRGVSVGMEAGANVIHSSGDGAGRTRVTPRLGINGMWSTPKFTIRLNYRNVTGYPTLAQQQGYGTFTDSLIYTAGNPSLAPSRSNILDGSVNILGIITAGGACTFVKDAIFDIAGAAEGMRPDGLEGAYVSYLYRNARSRSWRANVTCSRTFRQRWTVSATVSAEGREASWEGEGMSRVLPSYDWYVMYNSDRAALQLYLSSAMSPALDVTPQRISWSRVDGYSLSAVKFLFSHRLQIVAMWRMPFHIWDDPCRFRMVSPALTVHGGDDSYRRSDNQLQFTVVWRFQGGRKTRKYSRAEESVDLF